MPNPTVPAAATSLPSRRRALASIAGLGAALSLPRAAQATTLLPAPDPAVAELQGGYAASWGHLTVACKTLGAAEERVERPPMPEALWHRNSDLRYFHGFSGSQWSDGRWYYGMPKDIAYLRARVMTNNENMPDEEPIPDVGGRRRRDEIVNAYDEWQAAQKAAEDTSGYTAAMAGYDAASDANKAIRTRIIDLVSAGPAALRLKLQILIDGLAYIDPRLGLDTHIASVLDKDGPWDDAVAMSIARDLVIGHGMAVSIGSDSVTPHQGGAS